MSNKCSELQQLITHFEKSRSSFKFQALNPIFKIPYKRDAGASQYEQLQTQHKPGFMHPIFY